MMNKRQVQIIIHLLTARSYKTSPIKLPLLLKRLQNHGNNNNNNKFGLRDRNNKMTLAN